MENEDELQETIRDTNSDNYLVFQCSNCHFIVGDSTSWVSANDSLRTITLSRVAKTVSVGRAMDLSKSGADKGSTFYSIFCSCNTVVGKQYVASPPGLDQMRGMFTLEVEKLNSYELGCGETSGTAGDTSQPSLQEKLTKMQYALCVMEERIKTLEQQVFQTKNGSEQAKSPEEPGSPNVVYSESVSSSEHATQKRSFLQPQTASNSRGEESGTYVRKANQLLSPRGLSSSRSQQSMDHRKPLNVQTGNNMYSPRMPLNGSLASPIESERQFVSDMHVEDERLDSISMYNGESTRIDSSNVSTRLNAASPRCSSNSPRYSVSRYVERDFHEPVQSRRMSRSLESQDGMDDQQSLVSHTDSRIHRKRKRVQ